VTALLFLAPLAAAAASQPPSANEQVVIQHPLTPDDVVETVAGRCGRNLYQIRLEHFGNRSRLGIEVNGRPVTSGQIAKIANVLPQGLYLFEPFVDQCFRDRPNARMRLIVDGPSSHVRFEFLYFEVTPDGEVSNAHFG